MSNWEIRQICFRSEDNLIVRADWRFGLTQYAVQNISSAGLLAGEATETEIVEAVKASIGREKVAEIEAQEVRNQIAQLMPSVRSCAFGKVTEALEAAREDAADRSVLGRKSVAELQLLLDARKAFETAKEIKESAKEQRDFAVKARDVATAGLASAVAARDAAVAARDAAIAAGKTGSELQTLRDAASAAVAARAEAAAARDAAIAELARKNEALDAAAAEVLRTKAALQLARG